MAKIVELVPASNCLLYKGNWTTGTDYTVGDCVTWASDGHLYRVIKAHTSSSTLDPNNTEYYEPMTKKTVSEVEYNLIVSSSREELITFFADINNRPYVRICATVESSPLEFSISSVNSEYVKFYSIIPSDTGCSIYSFAVLKSMTNTPKMMKTKLVSGSVVVEEVNMNGFSLTVTYLD